MKKLLRDQRGNVLAIVCACMPLVVGAAGLATDTIQWTLWKRQLQRAADSAAMAGVYTSLRAGSDTDEAVTAGVTRDLALNLHTRMALSTTPLVERLGTSGNMRNQVRVTIRVQQRLPFSSMFMASPPTINAVATAASVPSGGEYCVIGTDRSAAVTGITISGSTNLNLGTCSLIANSSNPTAAASNGTSGNGGSGSTVTAASLDAAGGVNYSSQWQVNSYNPYSAPIDDPFASYVSKIPTSSAGCNKTGSVNKTNGPNGNNGNVDYRTDHTASDTVCLTGNQDIQGNVKLGPATYIIDGGNLGMTATGSSLSCDGCTIVLTNFSNPANTGTVNLTGGSMDLKPPRSSTDSSGNTTTIGNQNWKGMVLYQDPRATDNGNTSNAQNRINGNSSLSIQGAVYFGNQSLQYVGGGNTAAACLQVVAKRVIFGGNSRITAGSQCAGFGLGAIGGTRRVRLVA